MGSKYKYDECINAVSSFKKLMYEDIKPLDILTKESFINAIEASTGKKAIKEYLPMQPGDVQKTFANIDKAGQSLGFVPSTSVEEGIKKFVNWYMEYYER